MYNRSATSQSTHDTDHEETLTGHAEGGSNLVELITAHGGPGGPRADTEDLGAGDMDFLQFYGLNDNPFSDSVNPEYYYKTDGHDETYIRMMLTVRYNISLGLVTGRSGSGKTLISQMLLQDLDPEQYQAVLVLVSPGMSKTALLREILSELNLLPEEGAPVRAQDMLKLLSDYVIDLYHKERKLVILIDECHFLSSECLHILRTLSNIEVPERKLLTCLLFAEDRFLRRLEHPSYESLRNRMYMRGELASLSAHECEQYVKFRLLAAGRVDDLFDEEALAAVHKLSGGIGRRINKLCMLSLVEAFVRRKSTVGRATVEACGANL